MITNKNIFSILLLTVLGSLSALKDAGASLPDLSKEIIESEEHITLGSRELYKKPFLTDAPYEFTLTGKFAESNDFSFNASLLNKDVEGAFGKKVDNYYSSKVKLDITANLVYDAGTEVQFGIRAKSALGNPRAYSTTKEFIKLGEALVGEHSHMLEPRVFFLREGWINLDLNTLFNTYDAFRNLKVGLFPFEVGRGIALGENYAVNPASLGFFSDSTVDQYAPGLLLNGLLNESTLEYDMYAGLLVNKMTNLKETGAQIYDQVVIDNAYATNFARGCGHVNYVLASRLKWTPIDNKSTGDKIYLEPYVVYNYDGEQKVEFAADAKSKLVTFGLAGEFGVLNYEFGFEGAFNRGHQEVFALDRNQVVFMYDAANNVYKQQYTKINNEAAAPFTKTFYANDNADYRPAGSISSDLNGQAIGTTGKYNAADRFRDAYKNNYKGWMFVADASAYFMNDQLKISATAGVTNGDVNPNTFKTGAERDYKGFVPLQELYAGKRVKSFFMMGPTSSISRPHSLVYDDEFASPIEGFSNLRFVGAGVVYKPEVARRKFSVSPNLLMYWQDDASLKFGSTTDYASNKLGVELNMFVTVDLAKNVKFVTAAAIFKPGQHYTDLKGTQLTAQKAELSKLAAAGVEENLPTLSNNTAYSFTAGIECLF